MDNSGEGADRYDHGLLVWLASTVWTDVSGEMEIGFCRVRKEYWR